MLVLSRYEGEAIRIGPDVTVRVIGAYGRVKLGIEAPKSVLVDRDEVAKDREKDADRERAKQTGNLFRRFGLGGSLGETA